MTFKISEVTAQMLCHYSFFMISGSRRDRHGAFADFISGNGKSLSVFAESNPVRPERFPGRR